MVQTTLQLGDREVPQLPDTKSICVGSLSVFSEMIRAVRASSRLVVDVETTGLSAWTGDRIIGVSVMPENQRIIYYAPFRHIDENLPLNLLHEQLVPALFRPGVVHVGHNYSFDSTMFKVDGAPWPDRIEDTMLAAHLMNENEQRFRLEDLAEKYVDADLARLGQRYLRHRLIDHRLGKGEMWKLPASMVAPYANWDVWLTDRLHRVYSPALKRWGLYDIWQETGEYALAIARLQERGLLLDIGMVEALRHEAELITERAEQTLSQIAGYKVNPRSAPQMQALLAMPSTAREYLEASPAPVAQALLEHRLWDKMRGSYYEPLLKYAADGVIHPNINIIGTISGRASCSQPNLQAIPRKTGEVAHVRKVKDVFIAREGYELVQMDYKQAEVRLGTHYTAEPSMVDVFRRGLNIHRETAEELGIPYDAAKRINFACIYGVGAEKLGHELGIQESVAASYLERYHQRRPGFKRLYKDCEDRAKTRGYIRLWTGRVRHYNVSWAEHHKASSNLIQGGVAEIIRVAMTRLDHLRHEGFHQLLQVHDSVLAEVPVGRDDLIREARHLMCDFEFIVPFEVDIHHGRSWGNIKEWRDAT